MGTLLASTIINKVSTILFDINGVEWSRLELLGWLNDGQRQIVSIDPTSNNVTTAIKMVAGTRQALPADGWTLVDVYRNMGTNGTTPGNAVRLIGKKTLDQFSPGWHSATQAVAVQEFAFDGHDQTKYWVNPPSDGTGYVEVNYSQSPADIATEATAITLHDIFEPLLVDYILYRAGQKKVDYSPGREFAAEHFTAFKDAMLAKLNAEGVSDPNGRLVRAMPQGAPT